MAECRKKLAQRFRVSPQRRLTGSPRFCVRKRFQDPPPAPERPLHHSLVNQKQEDGSLSPERNMGPVIGPREIVLEMDANVTDDLIEVRLDVLVISMQAIMSEAPRPGIGEFTIQ
jgi:hypothetical protein